MIGTDVRRNILQLLSCFLVKWVTFPRPVMSVVIKIRIHSKVHTLEMTVDSSVYEYCILSEPMYNMNLDMYTCITEMYLFKNNPWTVITYIQTDHLRSCEAHPGQ